MNEQQPEISDISSREEQAYRIKAAMVLYSLERALGRLVMDAQVTVDDLTPSIISEIEKRRENETPSAKLTLQQTIEESYLSEIFQLALDTVKRTASWDRLMELKKLCSTLEIYRIRNAVSHPNRQFPECYYHRMAAISTDPLIELLGLNDVLLSFRCAEKGQLEEPPEEWLSESPFSTIPNNVPSEHDHAVTGLVGRRTELAHLRRLLLNQRVTTIAVTAPGGTGKTALVLEALHEISLDISFQEIFSCIAFVSLRTEKLTATGVQKLTASETIGDLAVELGKILQDLFDLDSADFKNALKVLADQNILICIDNLETLLRDSAISFDEFNLALPPCWRILVTSRVSVSSATTLPLDQLREKAAYHLTRNYAGRTGAGKIDDALLRKIVTACNCNPLAIRLTVDLFNLGRSIPESLGIATQNALDFSYRNLVNALSAHASQVLECLFLKDRSNVRQLSELLKLSLEEAVEAIRELFGTSLISRTTTEGTEEYSLNSSIRDLLMVNPTDLEFRTSLTNRIRRQQTLAKEVDAAQETRDVYDFFYIPDSCPVPLKLLLAGAIPELTRRNKDFVSLKKILVEFRQSEPLYEHSALFHRFFARILWCYKDRRGWERQYRRSLELEPDNPVTKSALAYAYLYDGMYSDAKILYRELLDAGWGEADRWNYSIGLVREYCRTLLYGKEYDELLEFTKKWKESGELKDVLGTFRATTWKRTIEKMHRTNPVKAVDGLRRAVRIMNDVLLTTGYNKVKLTQAKNIVQEIAFILSRTTPQVSPDLVLEWLQFAERHLPEIVKQSSTHEIGDLVSALAAVDNEENPFRSSRWRAFRETFEDSEDPSLQIDESEYTYARVCNIPSVAAGFPNYLFVEDSGRETYFVHFSASVDNDWERWKKLRIGSNVGIVPSKDSPKDGRSRRVDKVAVL